MENNFKCQDCGNDFFEPHYKIVISDITIYKYGSNEQRIKCPNCGHSNIGAIPKKGDGCPTVAKFGMMSAKEKAEALKKRANKHAQSASQVEQRKEINKQFKKKLGL